MAHIIAEHDEQDDGNLSQNADGTPQTPDPAPPAPEPKKKGKFEGKTPEEIEAAYEALEQRFGKQGEEVGELRRLTDEFIRSSLAKSNAKSEAPATTEPKSDTDDSEFFVNPRAAIKKLLEEDETIRDLRQHKTETQQERAQRIFKQKHPDTDEILNDPEFQSWVKASKVRTGLMIAAHTKLDLDAGDELFTTYKELKAARSPKKAEAPDTAEQIADAQKKAAGAPSGTTGTGEGGSPKKVYSRQAIMRLMIEDPEQYAARNDEFLQAYAEGRVRR